MQFTTHKHRQAPSVIIVSLIDVLLVVLIFLMVTTTFKQQPAVKLALPESRQQKAGASENSLIVTIAKQGPLYLRSDPVTIDTLTKRLMEAVQANPETTLSIRADTDAPWGQIVKVMDAAHAAGIKVASAFIRTASAP
jgi:biopolymer transport protein ExbD